MTVGIVIQARMGSIRLPGKVMRLIGDRLLLEHVITRLKGLHHSVVTVIATSSEVQDDVIADWCVQHGVNSFRGSESDVLDRYLACACEFGFSSIVRLTADNPFTDIEELDRLIDMHLSNGYDYSHSFGQMPLGVGAEIFSLQALKQSHAEGHAPNHREHVNEYIEEFPHLFKIGRLKVPAEKLAPRLRLTVDTEDDWLRASHLASMAAGRLLKTEELISLCS